MKKILAEMSPAEANRLRRVVERLQKAQQLEQFISGNVWTFQVQLEQLADQEVDECKRLWRESLLKHNIDPNAQDVQLDLNIGQVWVEAPDDSNSEPSEPIDTVATDVGEERNGSAA